MELNSERWARARETPSTMIFRPLASRFCAVAGSNPIYGRAVFGNNLAVHYDALLTLGRLTIDCQYLVASIAERPAMGGYAIIFKQPDEFFPFRAIGAAPVVAQNKAANGGLIKAAAQ